jgi:hypothetical protein
MIMHMFQLDYISVMVTISFCITVNIITSNALLGAAVWVGLQCAIGTHVLGEGKR